MTDSEWLIGGRYRVIGRIGSGGMADVLRARDESLNRDVAVKVFRGMTSTPDTAAGVERQHAELQALARLNHPNLTVLFDGSIVGQDGPAYLVMELVEGPSLAQRIEAGPVPEPQVRVIGAQIADALAYVHAAGMVHRDVKPANILLGTDGGGVRARLTDFGIVRLIGDERLTRVDMTLGSAAYLAPEQARGSSVGPPADVYALGLTLIEALTGARSFDGPPLEAVAARLSNDPVVPARLPEPWPGMLRAMTAREPTARPPARRVAQALRGGGPSTSPPPRRAPVVAPVPAPVPPLGPASGPQRSTAAPPQYPAPTRRSAAEPRSARGLLIAAGVILLALLILVGVVLIVSNRDGGASSPATNPTSSTSSTRAPGRTSTAATTADTKSSAPASDSGPASGAPSDASSAPSAPNTDSASARSGPLATPTPG